MINLVLMIGTSELLLIAALVLLLFGGKKLPEMMKGLGQGVRSFKDGMKETSEPDAETSHFRQKSKIRNRTLLSRTRKQQNKRKRMENNQNGNLMTFGEHLEVFRKMLFRIIAFTTCLAVIIFCAKDTTFRLLLAPGDNHFVTYRLIEECLKWLEIDFRFAPYSIQLINTELTSQFMVHMSTSVYLALLLVSPYIIIELYRYIAPALYENERRYSVSVTIAIYLLFILGVLMSYFVLFPFALRFLGTYQVATSVVNQINLDSYISTFVTLTLMMGLVFQLPVLSFS